MKLFPSPLIVSVQLGLSFLLPQVASAQGFLGHELSFHVVWHDLDGSYGCCPPLQVGTALVGAHEEFEAYEKTADNGARLSILPVDIGAFSIDIPQKSDFRWAKGNFNGFVFVDTNDSLPPFASATWDESVTTVFAPILVSSNTIWINLSDQSTPSQNARQRLVVTFDEAMSAKGDSLYPATGDEMILESPTQLGGRYQLEQSEDLISFAPVYEPFTALRSFHAHFIKSSSKAAYYRLRQLAPPSVPLHADFESTAEGWINESGSGETQWELGATSFTSLTKSGGRNQAWGTHLSDDYTPNSETVLRSPLVDLSTHQPGAALTFRYVIDTPEDVEGGQLRFVSEAGNVLHIHDAQFTGRSTEWTPFHLELPASLQNAKFTIEFRFLSDGDDQVGAGWFIDDVIVL